MKIAEANDVTKGTHVWQAMTLFGSGMYDMLNKYVLKMTYSINSNYNYGHIPGTILVTWSQIQGAIRCTSKGPTIPSFVPD